ncbi:hypothetical protein P5G62_010115 [Neobacillus sp. 179-C4.2 HS]|uniref:Uncharacterized protein n=1 Tax=Neobacillus driksii TaxID=3035913 RepID=A0ABV4YSB1_9BACI|nr:hypothetical protein [Neobacillus sp. 179.-C4.2 HS]MDP5195036.1 hypothetical protein [Neobacillus sp. 179.-C4.2 HS]
MALRKLLKKLEKYTLLFTFELVYRHGIRMKDLVHAHKNNYDKNTHSFTINQDLIKVDEDIHQLIIEHDVIPDRKLLVTTFNDRITEIKKWFGREYFIYKDIYQTHKLHYLPCPICETPTKNSPSLWAILEYAEDDSQWLVCKSCALRGEI